MERSDIIIIGGGPGGYEIAAELASKGQNVTLIERDKLGGTCLNRGCIPTKCLCATAQSALSARNATAFGVNIGEISIDYGKARERMNGIVNDLRAGIEQMLSAVNVVYGTAYLCADGSINVDGKHFCADKVLVATGSAPMRLNIPGAELAITSDDILQNGSHIPERLAIIGGGVIGIEFASIFNALGSEVTVLEYCKEILPQFDTDIAKRLRLALQARGVVFVTGASVNSIASGYEIAYATRKGETVIQADIVLMATGRRPILPGGLEEAGIALNERGFIAVDENMRTSREGFYAAGDVTGICMLAHAASAQAHVALSPDDNSETKLDIIPSAVFSVPEAAMVGLTPAECERHNIEYCSTRCNYASNGKAQADGVASSGLVKIVYSPHTRLILGVHILGAHASDLVAEAAALIYGMTSIDELAQGLVHCHPTLSELLQTAARAAK